MGVTVNLYGNLRVVMGRSEMKLDWTGGTLREMINRMAIQYGKTIAEELFDEDGEPLLVHHFTYGDFKRCVAKFVRANHVAPETHHWFAQQIVPNKLKENT